MDFDYGDVGIAEFSAGWYFWQWKAQWSFFFILSFFLSFGGRRGWDVFVNGGEMVVWAGILWGFLVVVRRQQ